MKQRLTIVAVLALALLVGASIPAFQHTGSNGLYLNGQGLGTATPVLVINSRGIPAEFKVNQTPVAQINSGLDMTGPANFDGAVDFDSTVDFSGATVTGVSTSTLSSLTVTGNTTLSGTLSVTGTSDLKGNVDIAGSVNFGSDDLYPLGYASDAQQIVCGTNTFTESAEITPTGLTTVTYVVAIQLTDPAATGAFLTASDPTTSTFVLSSWEDDYTVGTTPVAAHWCAVGDQ